MFNIAVFGVLVGCFLVFVFSDNMIAPGKWEVLWVEECDNPEQYEYRMDVNRKPMNRTHAQFSAFLDFEVPMDMETGIKVSICKDVDGGCKDYHTITDNSCLGLAKKTAEENFNKIRELMGVKREDYVEAGRHKLEGYVCDYCELPCKSVIGSFGLEVLLIDRIGVIKGCIKAKVEFREHNDDEEICMRCQEEDD